MTQQKGKIYYRTSPWQITYPCGNDRTQQRYCCYIVLQSVLKQKLDYHAYVELGGEGRSSSRIIHQSMQPCTSCVFQHQWNCLSFAIFLTTCNILLDSFKFDWTLSILCRPSSFLKKIIQVYSSSHHAAPSLTHNKSLSPLLMVALKFLTRAIEHMQHAGAWCVKVSFRWLINRRC